MHCPIRNIALIAFLSLSLSACSHTSDKNAAGEKIDLAKKEAVVSSDSASSPGRAATLASYGDAVWKSTDGAVEIFPLDAPAATGVSQPQSRPLQPPGRSVAVNDNVEIFPFDDLYTGKSLYDSPGFPSAATALIYYAHGSTRLSPADRNLISNFAQTAKATGAPIFVEGHASVQSEIADPVMRKIVNLKISMDRAFKVAEALMREGIPAARIETKAYGEERPPAAIAPGKSADNAARRVEIH